VDRVLDRKRDTRPDILNSNVLDKPSKFDGRHLPAHSLCTSTVQYRKPMHHSSHSRMGAGVFFENGDVYAL
jgi:hypothetical protein